MSHLKRQKTPKSWPIERKGTKYVVRPSSNLGKGIPLLIIVRDMLKLAKNRREVKKALNEKKILLNSKAVKNERESVLLFDVISLVPLKKNYKIELSGNGKFILKEIKENEKDKKISKIIDKKTLKNKKTQLNLIDGRNFLSEIKCNVNDSVIINLKDKKIEKCLSLKEKANAFIFAGKHSGKKGIIEKINSERRSVEMDVEGNKINVLIKQIIIIESKE